MAPDPARPAIRDTRYQSAFAGSLGQMAGAGLLIGAVCPAAAGLVLPVVSTAAMNAHLAETARTVAPLVGKMIPRIMS